MSENQDHYVSRGYPDVDEAIQAIQGLKAAGFDDGDIKVAATEADLAERVADVTGAEVVDGDGIDTPVLVIVNAGGAAEIARSVMVDGVVDALGVQRAPDDSVYLDPSSGSTAGVGTSTGTATGITPGSGYEGNTGSSVASSAGPLGQFAPRADTPDPDDDFPGRRQG